MGESHLLMPLCQGGVCPRQRWVFVMVALPRLLPMMLSIGPLSSHCFSHHRDSAPDRRNLRRERFMLAPGPRSYQSTVTRRHGGSLWRQERAPEASHILLGRKQKE